MLCCDFRRHDDVRHKKGTKRVLSKISDRSPQIDGTSSQELQRLYDTKSTKLTSEQDSLSTMRFSKGIHHELLSILLLAVSNISICHGFALLAKHAKPTNVLFLSSSPADDTVAAAMTPSAPPEKVQVLEDANQVGASIRDIVEQAAAQAISEKGSFALAIPGGSILKMLVGSGGNEAWTSKTTLAYVNHKCVSMDDEQLATHAKARKLFLDDWKGCQTILMDGTDNGSAEASAYEAKLRQVPTSVLPVNENGWPVFDLALIGVGDDGHVGSLYPNREEVLNTQNWVLPVCMKDPPSITLSLPVMTAAKQVVIAACGVSDKYPQGKSAGMYRAIEATDESLTSFPAVGLREKAVWVLDQAAASKLSDVYQS